MHVERVLYGDPYALIGSHERGWLRAHTPLTRTVRAGLVCYPYRTFGRAHAHARRRMYEQAEPFTALRIDAVPAERRTRCVAYEELSAASFVAAQHTPLVITGVPQHEG